MPFQKVTEETISAHLVNNLLFVRAYKRTGSWLPTLRERDRWQLLSQLHEELQFDPERTLSTICNRMDAAAALLDGTSMAGVRFAIANRLWTVDMNVPIDPALPADWLVRV